MQKSVMVTDDNKAGKNALYVFLSYNSFQTKENVGNKLCKGNENSICLSV